MENIRFAAFLASVVVCVGLSGCSATEESLDDEYVTDVQTSESERSIDAPDATAQDAKQPPSAGRSQRRFTVQADTLTVQSKKKEKPKTPPVTVNKSASQKYYSIQIGAYRLKSNADRNYARSLKRFRQPVIRFYEKGIKMERVCVGHFSSFTMARAFLKKIQQQYPADYPDAWVAELKQ